MRRSIRTRLLKTFLALLCAALALSFAFSLAGMRYLRDTTQTSAERILCPWGNTSPAFLSFSIRIPGQALISANSVFLPGLF